MRDENDIIFDQYTVDILGILRALFEAFGASSVSVDAILAWLQTLWAVAVVLLLLIAALSFIGFVYASIRFNQLAEIEYEGLRAMEAKYAELYGGVKRTRFADIEAHIASDNPNDWKLAIIEADIELEKALEAAGYPGNTVGEKLKAARSGSMETINDAWEAHIVRNNIAHQGADFVLTKRLAQQTITQYRRVFDELG